MIVALLLALGVAACGRKGGLDPPPAASVAAPAAAEPENKSIGATFAPSGDKSSSRNLPPPPSPKRDLFIDFFLN